MRSLISSLVVVGLVAGAVALGTSHAATGLPKPAPKPAKKVSFPAPMRPLHISEDGTPLQCERKASCKFRGKLGDGSKVLLSLMGKDGKQRFGLVTQGGWTRGEVTFKIPASVPAGFYGLTIVDAKLAPLSNRVLIVVTQPAAERGVNCSTNPDPDGDGHDAAECGGDDCDNSNGNRFVGNIEVCDAQHLDEDCDPETFGIRDQDRDAHPDAMCCNGDRCGWDCDDAQRGVSPTASEVCNQVDDDCDGAIDEKVMLTAFQDLDKDLYGDPTKKELACPHTVRRGWVTNDLDCDDSNGKKTPVAGCP